MKKLSEKLLERLRDIRANDSDDSLEQEIAIIAKAVVVHIEASLEQDVKQPLNEIDTFTQESQIPLESCAQSSDVDKEAVQNSEEKIKELEEKLARQIKLSTYKSDFVSKMAHDLRSPLNSFLLLAKMLVDNEERNLTDEQIKYVQVIYEGGGELLSMVNAVVEGVKDQNVFRALSMDRPVEEMTDDSIKMPIDCVLQQKQDSKKNDETNESIFLDDDRGDISDEDKCLLIIEDDQVFSKILLDLAHKRGFKCLAAGSGEEGYILAKKHKPSAIVLDIELPDSNGIAILERLKSDPELCDIPVNTMSSGDYNDASIQSGAIGFLTKPADVDSINTVINELKNVVKRDINEVLIADSDSDVCQEISIILAKKNVKYTFAHDGLSVINSINSHNYDCVVLGTKLHDMTLEALFERLNDAGTIQLPPIIIYSEKELTDDQNRLFSQYTNSILIQNNEFDKQLSEETSLFLHSIDPAPNRKETSSENSMACNLTNKKEKKILLVDDDMRNTFALTNILSKKGFDVVMADNGLLGLEELEANQDVDLVLMDIMMPIMDGCEAIAKIREDGRHNTLPIIALTAKAMAEDKDRCIEAGANDYMTKPVDVEKLITLMNSWMEQ